MFSSARTSFFQASEAPVTPASAASTSASEPPVATARNTAFSVSERRRARMSRNSVLRASSSMLRYALISASLYSSSLFVSMASAPGILPSVSSVNTVRNRATMASARAFTAASVE